jgi:hypothetical protein
MLRFVCFLISLTPLCLFFLVLVIGLFTNAFLFLLFFFFPYFFCWGGLGYIFGCGLISYGLVLLCLWICVLMILARESVFHSGYFPGFFVFVIIALTTCVWSTVHWNINSKPLPTTTKACTQFPVSSTWTSIHMYVISVLLQLCPKLVWKLST